MLTPKKYTRQVEVEAMQVSVKHKDIRALELWTDWFFAADYFGPGKAGFCDDHDGKTEWVPVNNGDWIVKTEFGFFRVMTTEDFHSTYDGPLEGGL